MILTVTFRIGRQLYGLPVAAVLEVVRLPALVNVAGAPPALVGLLNLRGRYLPILSGHVLVGAPPRYDLDSQIVIAGQPSAELGLLVDQVGEVTALPAQRLVPLGQGAAAPFLQGVIDTEEGSLLLFNIAELRALAPTLTNERMPG
jgi:purine-binding chemotaxis protein CheW